MGPLGVGTLIVKPFRYCLHVGNLSQTEAQELGPLLQRVSQVIQTLTQADQVYVCLWSHAGWKPAHIRFVVQPAWHSWREAYARSGPGVQMAMFQVGNAPPCSEVEAFCHQARTRLESDPRATVTGRGDR
jgi:diadenosine tetraphosphate (Ap4A) HIT family hydrolase